ncbi:2834_t:CDS:2 [Entrophospora sp. SA101]|nr:2834_t:CDS:2 [Entrophospora sp. SA101]
MRPAQHMQLVMPGVIRNKCTEFVENFSNDDLNGLSLKYRHSNTWKESEEDLVGIVEEILRALDDVWKNPAFRLNFVNMQSEEGVSQFVEALLILRNNLIVNISLQMNAPEAKSERQKKRSSQIEKIIDY